MAFRRRSGLGGSLALCGSLCLALCPLLSGFVAPLLRPIQYGGCSARFFLLPPSSSPSALLASPPFDRDSAEHLPGARKEYVSILRETVRRGCDISLMGRVYGNYKKRKLNIEHIVPRAVIVAALGESAATVDDACKDLYNMFLAVPDINRARRDYTYSPAPFGTEINRRPTVIYGKLNSKKRKYSENARDVWWSLGNGLFVNDRQSRFVPRSEDRGLIGRAILHMCAKWGCDADLVIDGGQQAAERWHLDNPPDQAELQHIEHVAQFLPYPHSLPMAGFVESEPGQG